MFGWMGIFEDGMMFALVDSGLLFFRVDDSNRVEFEAAGSSQFGRTSRSPAMSRTTLTGS